MKFPTFRAITAFVAASALLLQGCFFVREKPPAEPPPAVLSTQPEISMSDELVRTTAGDMIALLPEQWRLVDIEGKASADIFAVAVNPDYTLAAVFSRLRAVDRGDSLLTREGVQALARLGMARRERKTGGAVRQMGKISLITIGARNFGSYEFTPDGVLQTRVAVFTSSLGRHYEFALAPVSITGKPPPHADDISSAFRSILTTIQF